MERPTSPPPLPSYYPISITKQIVAAILHQFWIKFTVIKTYQCFYFNFTLMCVIWAIATTYFVCTENIFRQISLYTFIIISILYQVCNHFRKNKQTNKGLVVCDVAEHFKFIDHFISQNLNVLSLFKCFSIYQ